MPTKELFFRHLPGELLYLPDSLEKIKMEKALEFLKTHRDVALATVEGDRPKIRVFQIMLQEGTTLYFATSAKKEVYRQLQQNPNVELLAMDGDISVRVTGRACFDVPDDTRYSLPYIRGERSPAPSLSRLQGNGVFPSACHSCRLL